MRIDETNELYHQGGIYVHEIYHMDEKKLWMNYSICDIEIWIMNHFHGGKWQSSVIYSQKYVLWTSS